MLVRPYSILPLHRCLVTIEIPHLSSGLMFSMPTFAFMVHHRQPCKLRWTPPTQPSSSRASAAAFHHQIHRNKAASPWAPARSDTGVIHSTRWWQQLRGRPCFGEAMVVLSRAAPGAAAGGPQDFSPTCGCSGNGAAVIYLPVPTLAVQSAYCRGAQRAAGLEQAGLQATPHRRCGLARRALPKLSKIWWWMSRG